MIFGIITMLIISGYSGIANSNHKCKIDLLNEKKDIQIELYAKDTSDLNDFCKEEIIMNPNNIIMLKLIIENNMNLPLKNVTIREYLNDSLDYKFLYTQDEYYKIEDNVCYWYFDTLNVNESITIIFAASIEESCCFINNIVNVTAYTTTNEKVKVYDTDSIIINLADYVPVLGKIQLFVYEDQIELNMVGNYGYLYCWKDDEYHKVKVEWEIVESHRDLDPIKFRARIAEWQDQEPLPLLQFMFPAFSNIKIKGDIPYYEFEIPLDEGEISGSEIIEVRLREDQNCEMTTLLTTRDTRLGYQTYYVWGGFEIC